MKTHFVIVLDRSGSMKDNKVRTLSDYNEQVSMCKELSKTGEQEVLCYFISFNHEVVEHLWGQPATELQEGNNEQYECTGGTALYDAQGYTYQKLLERVVPHLEEKDAILIGILTDGEELSSKIFKSAAAVKELSDQLEATGKVTITLMGAKKHVVEQIARATGIPITNCAVYDDSSAKSVDHAYSQRKVRTKKYLAARSMGFCASANYMSDDNTMADFTNVDKNVSETPETPSDTAGKARIGKVRKWKKK